MTQADIGLIGLAVMGQNLAMNMNDHGYTVVVYNRTVSKVDEFMEGPAKGSHVLAAHTLNEFISKLKRPRKIILMVKAGEPVDEFINLLLPLLERGDVIIDGGNSYFPDTSRRCQFLKTHGIYFIGTGISGGEEGARHGPSIMPGGHPEAWPLVKDILQSIAAKVESGESCCDWVGDEGAGHYVKMVHNGIEYGDIQLICEVYALLRYMLGCSPEEIADIFSDWNKRELSSYLIEITSHVMRTYDTDGTLLLDKILDVAGQKGTGKWTVHNAVDMGVPVTLISEAVFSRCLAALKDERVQAAKLLKEGLRTPFKGDKKAFIEQLFHALYAAKMTSYVQGYMLMREASKDYTWRLNYGSIALMWRGGCIIRSAFLGKIKEAFDRNPSLSNLFLDDFFKKEILRSESGWRTVVATAVTCGLAVPTLSAALAFYDGLRTQNSPASLLQALRDYFGAHTYERVDKPKGEFFHTNWTGTGGKVSATSYSI